MCTGWNDNALALLMESYLNLPAERAGVDMSPYLDKDVPLVENITHDERRNWLRQQFLYFSSNRPRNKILPEIYDWEQIYKVLARFTFMLFYWHYMDWVKHPCLKNLVYFFKSLRG